MANMTNDSERITELEARVAALGATVKALLTTLMLRGLLTRAEIAPLLSEAEALMGRSAGVAPAAKAEFDAIGSDLPAYMRAAMGPAPDDDDHDH